MRVHLMHKLYVSYINPYLQNCVRRVELKTTKMRYRSRRGGGVGCASASRDGRDSDDDDSNVVRGYDSSDDERYK